MDENDKGLNANAATVCRTVPLRQQDNKITNPPFTAKIVITNSLLNWNKLLFVDVMKQGAIINARVYYQTANSKYVSLSIYPFLAVRRSQSYQN